ncbi:hypothetical protein [Ruficoccus sp. ZRK36]|uniref:hypothetical protein n=1 Tax=Ruficoccus sp. ZRK36 TaxID=2866311 RepID=UPI001C7394A0|nr:hypothetical protein [Ruficoccus sp. ZRK36]QYY35931.1 hypothetical protein K0V07_00310 [Ruficoccus sp. ZRK36]
MTLNELQRWILNHNQEDTWWVAIDGEVLDNLMALPDVGKVKDQNPDNEISVLHATKAEDEDAEWIIFEKETAQKFRVISEKKIASGFKMPTHAPFKHEEVEEKAEEPVEEAKAEEKPAAKKEPKPEKAPEPEPAPKAEPAPTPEPKATESLAGVPSPEANNEQVAMLKAELDSLKLAFAKLSEEVTELRSLADEVKQPLSEAKAILEEREQFLEMSENSLFEKAQTQEVMQNELEQMREELQTKERNIKAREQALAEKEAGA